MKKTRKLSGFSEEELIDELARRHVEKEAETGDMTDMEMSALNLQAAIGEPVLRARLARMKPEQPTAKACPRCGRVVKVKARNRSRTVKTVAGKIRLKRNYHYCTTCEYGFCPRDRELGLPEEGELSAEMEKRVLDFAVNDTYEQAAERWSQHYREPISSNLVRRVAERVGRMCEGSEPEYLNEELMAAPSKPSELLIVQNDGSMLSLRGEERWKEAKVGVLVRGDDYAAAQQKKRGQISKGRYVAKLGTQEDFMATLKNALKSEGADRAKKVVWIGDGAPGNWTIADTLHSRAIQILDWYHAVEHAMDCGRALLGEGDPLLGLWKERIEQLLMAGAPELLISEVMDCILEASDEQLGAINDLARYLRSNIERMNYRSYREAGLPIGSGIVESAHRHVIQVRMKRAGQHWDRSKAARMLQLRAAYRTAGAARFHRAIRRAHFRTETNPIARRKLADWSRSRP